jgi:hypothetical protein
MDPYVNTPLAGFDLDGLHARALHLFEQHRKELEREHSGEYCVIDLNSGKLFIGRTEHEARQTARSGAPKGFYTTFGIGFDASIRMRTHRHA